MSAEHQYYTSSHPEKGLRIQRRQHHRGDLQGVGSAHKTGQPEEVGQDVGLLPYSALTPDISRVAKPLRLDGVVMPHAQAMTLREAMATAARRGRAEGWPRCYYWAAVWWRLHAKESEAQRDPLQYSRNQMALYRDIERRPEHYKSWRRPDGMSDWQWSGLGHND